MGSINPIDSMKFGILAKKFKLKPTELSKLVIKKFILENYIEPSSEAAWERMKLGEQRQEIPIQSFIDYYNIVWLPAHSREVMENSPRQTKNI